MANSPIIDRIERELGVPDLTTLLAENLSLTDLQSLMLEVYRRQAGRRSPAAVLAEHEHNRFTRPTAVSPLRLAEWEGTALGLLPPGFDALALSPVCALGTHSAVALTDQTRTMSTIYNTEVVSDSTNVLALEGALRRRALLQQSPKDKTLVHLAATHRLLRTQTYNDPALRQHFSALALCSAGRDLGNLQFELAAFALHIGFYLRAIQAFANGRVTFRVAFTDFNQPHSPFAEQLFERLQKDFPGVACQIDNERQRGRDYYVDHCFHVYATDATGHVMELVDGGCVDWTQKLLSNAKERCVTSGIGSERVCAQFPR